MKTSFWRRVPGGWRSLLRIRARQPEEDVDAELRFHFDERVAELRARGVPADVARETAAAEFGDVEAVRDRLRIIDRRIASRRRRADWLESTAHDLRIALRRLRLTPTFTIAATLTLSIAIGATTSVFSVVDGVVLRPFPLREPDRILTILESNESLHLPRFSVSPMNFVDWQAQNHSFSALAASQSGSVTVTGSGDPERLSRLAVTGATFEVLGVAPVLGRALAADSNSGPEVVISYAYWKRRFGGATSVIGQTMIMDNIAHTIVGVLPAGAPGAYDLWTQLKLDRASLPRRDWHYLSAFGRLKPGVSVEQGTRDLQTIAARLAREYPLTDEGWTSVVTLPLQDALVEPVRNTLITLLAAAGCVLLIGVANLANLLFVRFLARRHDIVVRAALGATRARLFGEMLVEAALVGSSAAAIGVGLSYAGVRSLRTLAPATFPRIAEIHVDGQALAFCALTSLAATFVFAALPAWQLLRGGAGDATRDAERAMISPRGSRLQAGLVVMQVAIAFVLLAGAGLFVKTFIHFQQTELGFTPEHLLTADVSLPDKRYSTPALATAFASSVVERLATEPGVVAAGASSSLPGNSGWRAVFTVVGDPPADPMRLPNAHPVFVTPDYFRAMGIAVTRGRGVRATDGPGAVKVAVIDEALARRAFPNRDPVGLRIALVGPDADTVQIVGISSTVKQGGLVAENVPWFYLSMAQSPAAGSVGEFVMRTSDDPLAHARALRSAVTELDNTVPLSNVEPMTARVAQTIDTTRFSTFLASLFAGIALVLSLIGIYSVLAYVVAQRRREIAIRLALGANIANVMGAVLWRAIALTGAGIAFGLGAAWWLTRAMAGLFEGVSPHDPRVFVGAAIAFATVGLVAAAVPAVRTARVDPVTSLRSS